jgi:hypothetical protein
MADSANSPPKKGRLIGRLIEQKIKELARLSSTSLIWDRSYDLQQAV